MNLPKTLLVCALLTCFLGCGAGTPAANTTDTAATADANAALDGTAAASDALAAGDGDHHEDGEAHADGDHHADGEHHEDGDHHEDGSHAEDGTHEEDGHDHGTGSLTTHIHMIDFWGANNQEIALGTHTGVYRTEAGSKQLVKVGGEADFMGFVRDPFHPDTYWGSGHNPEAGLGLWGFIESTDGAKSWKVKSLSGSADFHQLDASPTVEKLVGGTWGAKLWVSVDAGATWKSYAWTTSATGVQFESASSVLLASQANGIERVTLPALTSKVLVQSAVSGLCRHGAGLMYGTYDGKVHVCDADAAACTTLKGPSPARVIQCLVDPKNTARLYVLVSGSEVYHSDDSGKSWELVAGGI